MRKGTILPIAVMAFAIVAFLFVVTYAVTPGLKYPWSTNTTAPKAIANVTTNDSTVSNVNTDANTNTVVDSTADWKTYTNTSLGYSFKYPSTYTAESYNDSATTVIKDASGKIVSEVKYRLDAVDGSLTSWYDTVAVSDATLGDRTGKKFIYKYCDGPSCGEDTVAFVVQHQNKLLGLEFPGDKVLSTLESQILSTFTFTQSATADWKTYTNSEYSYSFKYPQTYAIDQSGKTGVTLASSQNCLAQKKNLPDAFDQVVEINGCSFFSASVQGNKIIMGGRVDTGTTIDDLAAEKFISEDSTQAGSVLAQVEKAGQWFILQNAFHNSVKNETLSVFDQVLSTFNFTSPTADWKPYANTKYGFGFKYPNNLTFKSTSNTWTVGSVDTQFYMAYAKILDRAFDAKNITASYSLTDTNGVAVRITDATEVSVGSQKGYRYREGDAGCSGTAIQTVIKNNKTLLVCLPAPQATPSLNYWHSDLTAQSILLSTFTFTK